jgi:hypothetical protein
MRTIVAATFTLLTFSGLAQKDTSETAIGIGYTLGFNRSILQFSENPDFLSGVTDHVETNAVNAMGASIGISLDYDWADNITQRLSVSGLLNQAEMEFQFTEDRPIAKHVFPMAVEAASYVDYMFGSGKTQPKAVAGLGFIIRGGGDINEVPNTAPYDLHLKLGAGLKMFRPKTRLNLDLVYSHSLTNLLLDSDQIQNQALGILQKHYVTLIFHGY